MALDVSKGHQFPLAELLISTMANDPAMVKASRKLPRLWQTQRFSPTLHNMSSHDKEGESSERTRIAPMVHTGVHCRKHIWLNGLQRIGGQN